MSTFTADNPTPIHKSFSERINIRLIVFLTIIAAPLVAVLAGLVFYNGGISHTADGDLVDLKALGNFAFDEANGTIKDVPPRWRALDGKRVVLDGFMVPLNSSGPKTGDFQFVFNIQICCFNGPPKVQERVFVHVGKGRQIPFIDGFARIVGTLHVNVQKKDGVIPSVYTMDVDRAWKND